MTTKNENVIPDWDKSLQNEIKLSLRTNNSSQSLILEEFCEKLSAFAPKVIIEKSRDSDAEEPYIKTENNVIIKAIPEEKLLHAFLNLIRPENHHVHNAITSHLKNFDTPISLSIYISPFCPFCPKVVSDVSGLAFANKNIEIVIIDGSLFPELAERYNVVSAPTVIFNEHFRWTGNVNAVDIAEVIGNSKPEELSLEALRAIVENGKAKKLADLMLKADTLFPAFYELITHEKWPVRLGAMVTLEEIAEVNRTLSEQALSFLWDRFASYSSAVQGDIIYITGESGGINNIERVMMIINGDYNSDLKEIAEEAAETLNLIN